MLNKKIRILDFDGSVTSQKKLLQRRDAEIINLTDIGPRVRFWANQDACDEVSRRIVEGGQASITFLGSGDFHHITKILLEKYNEPISIIDFDFHQDWDATSHLLHCGSWVAKALKRKNILKCITLGASAKKMKFFSLQGGDLRLLENDRLELYPYTSKPGIVFIRHVPQNISFDISRYPLFTRIFWKQLKYQDLSAFFTRILERLPTKNVYITIDKDCMDTASALTNWDQGEMTINHLCTMLKIIKDRCNIIGMDITGDYSPIKTDSVLKALLLKWNHPVKVKAANLSPAEISTINELSNLKILETMIGR